MDKEKYGTIKDVTDKGYYTNSYHVDVREKIDAFEKLTFESEFQKISSGGAISYVEIPNMQHNILALETAVKFIYDNIQYAEFNTKSDYCHVCGFNGEIIINDNNEWECPNCGNKDHSKMNVVRRTCGYLGENFWNAGKTKEIKQRVFTYVKIKGIKGPPHKIPIGSKGFDVVAPLIPQFRRSTMNYADIKKLDVANGEGVRVSLFVSGCNHHCKGCFNQCAWDFNYGDKFTDKEKNKNN